MAAKVHRLELVNFKSYAGKVVIGPFHDYSCIVGPNGAGKSNLMDALSFVLGSPAETLRGQKWEDLINRKSKKGSDCSVTLVLRLASGNEVSFTRSVSSRGQTSTQVDNVAVNEQAFTSMLRQHKIGKRVSSYLVFQHEVDAVAQKKAKELTDLIEEVSGSGELKREYNEKKQGLEDANEQLAAASVEKRGAIAEVNQMRLHKKEADRFTEINDKLQVERRDLALCELFFLESQLARRKAELAEHSDAADKLSASITTEEAMKRMKKEFAEKHKVYLETLKQSREAAIELREKKGTMDRIHASIEHFQHRLEKEKEELAMVKESNTVRSKETQRLEQQIKQQEALLTEFEEKCRKEDAEAAKQSKFTPEQLVEYKKLKTAADCETITARQELEVLRRQRDSLAQGLKHASAAMENQDANKQEVVSTIQRHDDRARETQAKIADLKRTQEELSGKAELSRTSLAQVQARARERNEELQRIEHQLNELRHVKDDTKQSERMNEALSSLRALHSGIKGRLVDLVTIPQERYKNAVTVAFGKNLDAVVVDTTETAMACVRHLKEQRIAFMTFIPLASVSGKPVDDRLRTMGGTCKPIVDVLRYDSSLEPALRYAIGQTLVCDAMDEARRVAFGGGERFKVVTLDGSMLLKNGSIQGGLATVQARARKWDEKQYDTLKTTREALLRDIETGAEEARSLVEAKDLESRVEFTVNRIKQLDVDLLATGGKTKALVAELKKQDEQVASLKKRAVEYEVEIGKCESKMLTLQKTITGVETRIFGDFQKKSGIPNIAEMEQRELKNAKARAEKRQQLTLVIHKLKSSLESELKRVGAKNPKEFEQIVARTEAELKTCHNDLAAYKKVMDSVTAKQETVQQKLAKAKAEVDLLEDTIRKQGKASETDQRALQQARKNVTMVQSSCEVIRQQRLSLYQRCRMDEVGLPTAAADDAPGKKRQRVDDDKRRRDRDDDAVELIRVSEAFTTSFSEPGGRKEVAVCIDFSGLPGSLRSMANDRVAFMKHKQSAESLIDQLERELESIAPNLKATERFATTEAKLGSVTCSVEESREKARKAMIDFVKIKERRVKMFMDTFDKIVENVDRVYRELTLGTRAQGVHGSAYLSLEDAEEPYNGGTKYHATPPMKRFMTMELLSGGERTMAALALLFAIHNISPAPFFVLDEVGAALDTANVQKLSHYLRTHSSQCQFLVVSLKDQLYHLADSLVGVYKDHNRESSGILTMDLRGVPV